MKAAPVPPPWIGELANTTLFELGGTRVTPVTMLVFAAVIVLTLVASRLSQRALERGMRFRHITDEGSVGVAKRLLHYLVLLVGLGFALQIIGIKLSTLFAAGAVFAIGVGFAMQNIAQNFVSGLIMLIERSIKPGDVLQVDGRFVKVRQMGIRATIARTLDDEELIIPNSLMVQSVVTNYTLNDSLYRLRASVGVVYSSDLRLVRETLERVARILPWRVQDKEPVVILTEFGDSSVNYEVSVWMEDPWGMRRARSDLYEAIWWAFKEQDLIIAFPQLDVHFDPPVLASLTALPAAGGGAHAK